MARQSKDTVRAQSLASREARAESAIALAGETIAAHEWNQLCTGELVTCFVSMATEPPTAQLRKQLSALGKSVALPIMKPGRTLAWGFDGLSLEKNSYGILEPASSDIDLNTASAIIIPALRVGLDGSRLGRGAGYYDRALANLAANKDGGPRRICLVFDDEVDESVPAEPHDAPIDVIVTPTRIIEIN
ncbi:MAG: 5-formyltetrahydrofolate cyclo-ligase [Actinomycetes bacterium]